MASLKNGRSHPGPSPRRLVALLALAVCLVGCAGAAVPLVETADPDPTAEPEHEAALQPTAPPNLPAAISQPTTSAPARPTSQLDMTSLSAGGLTYQTLQLVDGSELTYALALPNNYEAGRAYPVLLALPPGAQTRSMVAAGLDGLWQRTARERGWIVVSPIAPGGVNFFSGSEVAIPELLDEIGRSFVVEGGRFALGGISNGGNSAFRIALNSPDRFESMVVIPGVPPSGGDFAGLEGIKHIPIAMYVGENDSTAWVEQSVSAAAELDKLGADVTFEIVPNNGHVVTSIDGAMLFDFFESHH